MSNLRSTYTSVIDNYIALPLSGAMAGYIVTAKYNHLLGNNGLKYNLIGAAIGAGLSYFDNWLVENGYTDHYYISWTMIGGSATSVIIPDSAPKTITTITTALTSPGFYVPVAGGIVGSVYQTKYFENIRYVVAPIASAYLTSELPIEMSSSSKAAIGALIGITDEVLYSLNYTNSHYFTLSVAAHYYLEGFNSLRPAFINAFDNKSPIALNAALAVPCGLFLSKYEKSTLENLAFYNPADDLYAMLGNVTDVNYLQNKQEKLGVLSLANTVTSLMLTKQLNLYFQLFDKYINQLAPTTQNPDHIATWSAFKGQLLVVGGFAVPYLTAQIIPSYLINIYANSPTFRVSDNIRDSWLTGETAIKFSRKEGARTIIDNLNSDVAQALSGSASLTNSYTDSLLKGLYGLTFVTTYSPKYFVASLAVSQLSHAISEAINNQTIHYTGALQNTSTKIVDITKHDQSNMNLITQRGGLSFTQATLQDYYNLQRDLSFEADFYQQIRVLWNTAKMLVNFVLRNAAIGYDLHKGKIPEDLNYVIQGASREFTEFLSFNVDNAQAANTIQASMGRLSQFFSLMNEPNENEECLVYNYSNNTNQISVENLSLSNSTANIVSLDKLELNLGEIYGVTGASGSGKTSFLVKLKGIRNDGIKACGNITYPIIEGKEIPIIMVPQKDYFPQHSTLAAALFYPNKVPDTKELEQYLPKINAIFNNLAFNIHGDDLLAALTKEEISLENIYSGGEKKKITIANILLNVSGSAILILDETFVGLDKMSGEAMRNALQQLAEKHGLTILVIDHEAAAHNENGFYSHDIHFQNGSATINVLEAAQSNQQENSGDLTVERAFDIIPDAGLTDLTGVNQTVSVI